MAKERIYLTDITLHTRSYRPTVNFSKVAEKGRFYSPTPADSFKKPPRAKSDHVRQMVIELPADLKARLDKGEVELMMPKDGLNIYAGKDVYALMDKMRRDGNRAEVHKKWGAKQWHDKKKGV